MPGRQATIILKSQDAVYSVYSLFWIVLMSTYSILSDQHYLAMVRMKIAKSLIQLFPKYQLSFLMEYTQRYPSFQLLSQRIQVSHISHITSVNCTETWTHQDAPQDIKLPYVGNLIMLELMTCIQHYNAISVNQLVFQKSLSRIYPNTQ